MKVLNSCLVLAVALLVPAPVSAHEGHGFDGTVHSLMHWLSDPYHIVLLAAGLVAVVATPFVVRRIVQRRPEDVQRIS